MSIVGDTNDIAIHFARLLLHSLFCSKWPNRFAIFSIPIDTFVIHLFPTRNQIYYILGRIFFTAYGIGSEGSIQTAQLIYVTELSYSACQLEHLLGPRGPLAPYPARRPDEYRRQVSIFPKKRPTASCEPKYVQYSATRRRQPPLIEN